VIRTAQNVLLNSVTQWKTAILEKSTVPQLVQKFPALYGIQTVATLFRTAHHLSLSWNRLLLSMPTHLTSLRTTLMISPIYT